VRNHTVTRNSKMIFVYEVLFDLIMVVRQDFVGSLASCSQVRNQVRVVEHGVRKVLRGIYHVNVVFRGEACKYLLRCTKCVICQLKKCMEKSAAPTARDFGLRPHIVDDG
jgi:hypothetical protein